MKEPDAPEREFPLTGDQAWDAEASEWLGHKHPWTKEWREAAR